MAEVFGCCRTVWQRPSRGRSNSWRCKRVSPGVLFSGHDVRLFEALPTSPRSVQTTYISVTPAVTEVHPGPMSYYLMRFSDCKAPPVADSTSRAPLNAAYHLWVLPRESVGANRCFRVARKLRLVSAFALSNRYPRRRTLSVHVSGDSRPHAVSTYSTRPFDVGVGSITEQLPYTKTSSVSTLSQPWALGHQTRSFISIDARPTYTGDGPSICTRRSPITSKMRLIGEFQVSHLKRTSLSSPSHFTASTKAPSLGHPY